VEEVCEMGLTRLTREQELAARIREAESQMDETRRLIKRLNVEKGLSLATQVALEEDPDGTTGVPRALVLTALADEIDDAPEEVAKVLDHAVKMLELCPVDTEHGVRLYINARVFERMGLA
jgi:hypothetical protein